ncbi:MAG: GNAT family N-acetyltransferase [Bacteroidota bacterium]
MKANYTFRQLDEGDAKYMQALVQLFQEVFELAHREELSIEQCQSLLAKSDFIVWVVFDGSELVGGVTAFELPMYKGDKAELFVYDLAVHPDHQRRGLGRRLMRALMDLGRLRGIPTLFVDADEEDTHALDFYRALGGEEVAVRQYTWQLEVE